MILVDSSALIEFYRPKGLPNVRAAVAEAIDADLVAVNGVIQVEILAFSSPRTSFTELLEDFKVFHWLDLKKLISTSLPRSAIRYGGRRLQFQHRISSSLRRQCALTPSSTTLIPITMCYPGTLI